MRRWRKILGGLLALMLLGGAAGLASAGESVTYQGWRSVTVDRDIEELDLGDLEISEWEPFYAFLEQLPKLKEATVLPGK